MLKSLGSKNWSSTHIRDFSVKCQECPWDHVWELFGSKFPDLQIFRFPNDGGNGDGPTLRSQLDPSPNAHRDQIRRKEPLLRRKDAPKGLRQRKGVKKDDSEELIDIESARR